jgi:biopolymer transport protein ExbB/TolQ
MDINTWLSLAITLLFTAVSAVIGGYVKSVRDDQRVTAEKLENLQNAHTKLRVEVAGEYMKKADLQTMHVEFKQDMKELIEQIREDIRANIARIESQVRK